jgi:hypothetical protein
MASLSEIAPHLKGYGINSCHVRSRKLIGFTAQKWVVDDSLEPRDTMVMSYFPDDPKDDRWAASEIDQVTGVHGCGCFKPQESWIFVTDMGEVFSGRGDNDGYEQSISSNQRVFISSVKCIARGFAYAVGINRDVYRRVAPNKWVSVKDKALNLLKTEKVADAGFRDIDGFSDSDIYACGGRGDLWHFDGKHWSKEDIPTNANLERACCGDDGLVYVTTNSKSLLIGKRGAWRVVDQDIGDEGFVDIVNFESRILVSTDDGVWESQKGKLVPAKLRVPKMKVYSHLAAGDGLLVVAGANEASLYDGSKWSKILRFA